MNSTKCLSSVTFALMSAVCLLAFSSSALATNVVISTSFGEIEIELFDEQTPTTVANFLQYVEDDAFEDSIIHRSIEDFVIQGGGFQIIDDVVEEIPVGDPIVNEPGISNTRGTIAMAKLSGDPDSATSGWFINLSDNSENLDAQNGGFTVFGQVVGDGMQVVDEIAALRVWNLGTPFNSIPLIDWDGATDIELDNLVRLDVNTLSEFSINPGMNDAWFNETTSGQGFFFTVFPGIEQFFLSWFTYDAERPPEDVTAIIGEPGHRWLTAIGSYSGNRAVLDVALSEGGLFDEIEPLVETTTGYGQIEIVFSDCSNATLNYDLPGPGLSGTIELKRAVQDNVALCEALQDGSVAD